MIPGVSGAKDDKNNTFVTVSPKTKPILYRPMPQAITNSMGLPVSYQQAAMGSPQPGPL